ncbi:uncharacterized protein LOC107471614 [Arachis duranensis]|uniref:Uncharacterized protein LOC107471614 n=1 Tax=Arachis duranensis TaxID=130453 RepID=A0A6P4CA84_ARADU|nr:uncharacterized protein LOC107471614 [Arachis duranensis]
MMSTIRCPCPHAPTTIITPFTSLTNSFQSHSHSLTPMEGITVSVYKSFKDFQKRRRYRKLHGSGRRSKSEQLGSRRRARFWGWRVKVAPKIRIRRVPSPKKMLLWLRDAYVRMMLGFANSRVMTMNASATGFGGPYSVALGALGPAHPKEYDEKVIVQIYKSLVAAGNSASVCNLGV